MGEKLDALADRLWEKDHEYGRKTLDCNNMLTRGFYLGLADVAILGMRAVRFVSDEIFPEEPHQDNQGRQ